MNIALGSQRPGRFRAFLPAMLACVPLTIAAAGAATMPQAGIEDRLLACRHTVPDALRLRCFDRLAASVAANPPDAVARDQPVARTIDPRKSFGLSASAILAREFPSDSKTATVRSIAARIAGLQVAPDGRTVYRLANGQVWEQLLNDGDAPPVKTGDPVRIARGWLGSYWMQTASGRGCKVERVR